MKNLFILLILSVCLLKSQSQGEGFDKKDRKVNTINELIELGYQTGTPVFRGEVGGKKIYTVSYSTNNRCKGKKLWCKSCPGCCNTGYVDYEEDLISGGNIRRVMVGGVDGDLYKFPGENTDIFIPKNSSCD